MKNIFVKTRDTRVSINGKQSKPLAPSLSQHSRRTPHSRKPLADKAGAVKKPQARRHAPKARAPRPHNYAFIDSQNVHKGVSQQGWQIDWKQFRRHLQMRYNVDKAMLFIGFVEGNEPLYDELRLAGFTVVLKPTVAIHDKDGNTTVKGNVDTDLVLHAMLEKDHYDGAVIASGDGDFHSLAKHLKNSGKLANVMVPSRRKYSTLLKEFDDRVVPMDDMRKEIGVK